MKPSERIAELADQYRKKYPLSYKNMSILQMRIEDISSYMIALGEFLDEQAELLDTHTVKEEKLGCGCVKNTCKCDPMRHWPPVCCDKCPSLPKEEPTTPEKKCCGHKKWTLSKSTKRGTRKICNNCGKDWKNEWETPKLLPTSSYEVTCGRCEKHQEFKYVHGWDNLTDCESCFKEWRKEKGL